MYSMQPEQRQIMNMNIYTKPEFNMSRTAGKANML